MCYNVKKMCRKSSPAGEGLGEGPLSCGIETVRQKGPLNLCAL